MFAWSILSLALCAASAVAAPRSHSSCSVPASALQTDLPTGQTALVAPSFAPNFVALGVGVQNYSCSAAGTFTNIGAVAELFDVSCLYGKSEWKNIQTDTFKIWNASTHVTTQELITFFQKVSLGSEILGQHYFIPNPSGTGANVPKFDFSSAFFNGNPDAFVVASKVGDIPSPQGAAQVDWLSLNSTAGKLATQVFRVDTVAGQDKASCTPGQTASVKYVAKYFYYGSQL